MCVCLYFLYNTTVALKHLQNPYFVHFFLPSKRSSKGCPEKIASSNKAAHCTHLFKILKCNNL